MKTKLEEAIESLSAADDANLYARLGAYSIEFPQSPHKFAEPRAAISLDVKTAGALSASIELGQRILKAWNRSLYDLTCAAADPQAKKTIVDALHLKSADGIAAAITGILISTFSVGPAIATIVGVLLGRVLLPAAGRELCAFWKEKL